MIAISRPQFAAAILFAVSFLGVSIPQARAQLTLTPAGVTDGFTLSTFVSGYNFSGIYGPIGQAVLPNGNIVTGSSGDHNIYVFADTDNHTLGTALIATAYACQTGNCNFAMATAGGQAYGAQAFGGTYEHFANNGTFSQLALNGPSGPNVFSNLGMAGDPVNGHLISASQTLGLIDIDPTTGTYRILNTGAFPDGVTVSPDGTKIYGAVGSQIIAWSMATGVQVDAFNVSGGPDGTGVLIGGAFNGDIVINNNDGTVGLLDPITRIETIIASGGTRGDFASPDTNNGTLFLSEVTAVYRLNCGPGCSISVTPGVPEPSTWAMMLLGFIGLGIAFRQSRRKVSFA